MDFAKKLKEIRTEKGYTQRYISEIVNKTITAVCDWERGRTQPSIEDLITISKVFDCSVDYLLGIEDENGLIVQTTTNALSTDEERILQNYRKIQQPHIKQMVESYIENVIEIEKQDLKKRVN